MNVKLKILFWKNYTSPIVYNIHAPYKTYNNVCARVFVRTMYLD